MDKVDYFDVGDMVLIHGLDETYVIRSIKDGILELEDASGDVVGFCSIDAVELV